MNSTNIECENKIYKLNYYYLFLFNLLIIGMSYVVLTRQSFSMDSYLTIHKVEVSMHLLYGRFVNYLIGLLLNILHISPFIYQSIFIFLLIIVISGITIILFKMFSVHLTPITPLKLLLIDCSILLFFINIFFLEWFMFPESIPFTIIHLSLTFLSIRILAKGLNLKNIIISFLLIIIAINMYQIELVLFAITCITLTMLENKSKFNIKSITGISIVLIIGLFASVVNMIIFTILKKIGMSPSSSKEISINVELILNNIKQLYNTHKNIWWNGLHLMPEGLIAAFGIILGILLIYTIINERVSFINIVFIFTILIINYLINYAPHIFLTEIWTTQRTMVGFFLFLSSVLLIIIYLNNSKIINIILLLILCLFLAANYISIQYIAVDHYASNKIDQEFSILTYNKILDYEKTTGNQVKRIATRRDKNPTWAYSSIEYATYETNLRGFIIEWDDVGMINYYSGRNFEKISMDESIYNKYFKDKDWTYFNPDEQMVFVGDTLYMMMY